ncbi:MAG: hypothetical protein O7B26_03865, partial [Planctomycetota bacterium]|nr:hypothetical protein [Planctomycetota bacterium]
MRSQRNMVLISAVFAVVLVAWPAQAPAQFGSGFGRTLFRGLEYAGSFDFLSSPQNGPFFNDNIFTHRVEQNRAGGGFSYEQWRFFGTDSYNNATTLDLGPLKIDLGTDPQLASVNAQVGLHTRTGYTTTLIPEVFFQQETAQRRTSGLTSQTVAQPLPIRYDITLNTGVEDLRWTGNIFLNTEFRINILGFYDYDLRLTNVGTFDANGALIVSEEVTDFDIGPIDTSGHIVLDAIAFLFQAVGGPGAAVPVEIASAAAQKEKTLDEIMAQVEAGEELSDEDVAALMHHVLTTALFQDPLA